MTNDTIPTPSGHGQSGSRKSCALLYQRLCSMFPSRKKRYAVLAAAGVLSLMVLFSAGLGIFALTDPYDCRILDNVSLGGLDVGDMTPLQAFRTLRAAEKEILKGTDLILEFPEETLHLSPGDSRVRLRTAKAVWQAFRHGRTGTREQRAAALESSKTTAHPISLASCLKVNEEYIRGVISSYAQSHNTDCTPSSWQLVGQAPDLEAENFTEDTPCQTLELTTGLPTARLEQQDAYDKILAVYADAFGAHAAGNYVVRDFPVTILEEPEAPVLQEIYDAVYVAAVDDTLDMQNYVPIPGAYGYHFDLKAAQKQADCAGYGEVVSIPMEVFQPEIFGDGVYFRDVLGSCETPHTQDENRNNNLRLACQSMNGLILQPGEVFSYNDTLGERTKERGYKRAGAYSGWELVQSYGGGICQGSSTIYCAALYADLEIVFRRNHGYAVGYIPFGLDATVNWGGPDFQFRNNYHFPIKIAAEVSDGHVKVTILGTEERDHYVEMESEASITENHIYAKSFKCKYDRQTGELISREMEARSTYNR